MRAGSVDISNSVPLMTGPRAVGLIESHGTRGGPRPFPLGPQTIPAVYTNKTTQMSTQACKRSESKGS